MNSNFIKIFIFVVCIVFCILCIGIYNLTLKINKIQNEVSLMQEDYEIHKQVFNSHLKGTLSEDWGEE